MSQKRTYFPPTTPQQRKLLFENWEATGNVAEACRKAHVGRATFYYWKPRFVAEGYAGLERYQRKGPEKGSVGTPAKVRQKVIEMRRLYPEWGKHRISDEMTKANNWVPLVSPNTVGRILAEAGLWKPDEKEQKKTPSNRQFGQQKSLDKPST
jgi:transposase